MAPQLHILLVEDNPTDAELTERELRSAKLDFVLRRVVSRDEFTQALQEFDPDIALVDYSVPGFGGDEALSIAQRERPDVPFVFVSGAIGEDTAIEALKKGATDYVLKHRLSRLLPSVQRALREAEERRSRRQAEAALRRSEQRHRTLLEINNAIIADLDRDKLFGAVAKSLNEALASDHIEITLYDIASDVLNTCFSHPRTSNKAGIVFRRDDTHVGWVFDNRTPMLRRHVERELEFSSEQRTLHHGCHSLLCVPLVAADQTLGTLQICSVEPGRYDERDMEFLKEVARQIALAVANMRAFEEIEELKARLEHENLYLQEEIKTIHGFDELVGRSPAFKKVLNAIASVAPTDTTVLICGETGTGKELIARYVHELSAVNGRSLVTVNCAALPTNLIESELFGHERGAFTGAVSRKIGRFELAHEGTIFLDEIGDLPLELQAKLLRVLQEGDFQRVGGTRTITAKVRVIAATNRDLDQAVREGRFRADLFYRLNVFPIQVPPLRDRRTDVAPLVRFFVEKYAAKLGKNVERISQHSMNALEAYEWPGNIRELENTIERAMVLSDGSELELRDSLQQAAGHDDWATLDEVQRQHILKALEWTDWCVSGRHGAAELLGIKATTLEARMKKLGIRRERHLRSTARPH